MNNIVKILMERDGITRDEAIELINETREMMIANPREAENIMLEMLELEMDYIFDIL